MEVRLAALWRGRRPAHRSARAGDCDRPTRPRQLYEAPPIVETPQNKARREVLEGVRRESEEPRVSECTQRVESDSPTTKERRAQASLVHPQGTPWKVLDLAKLEPPRRQVSRALNVAALLADFRSLLEIERTAFVLLALEAALLKNEPMKNEVTCYNVVRTFSTKVVPKVADHWKSERGQLESWWTAVALGDPLALLVGRLAEERRDGLSPDLALRAFSKAAIEAMDDAAAASEADGRLIGSRARAITFYTRVGEGAGAGAKSSERGCPTIYRRTPWSLRSADVHRVPWALEGDALCFGGGRSPPRGFRITADAGEIVEHFTKRGGELAPIQCCGEDCYYLFDKGISPTIHFLRTRPGADELDRFYSAENFLQSLGDFTGVKDSKLGHRISLAFTSTTPTVTLALASSNSCHPGRLASRLLLVRRVRRHVAGAGRPRFAGDGHARHGVSD